MREKFPIVIDIPPVTTELPVSTQPPTLVRQPSDNSEWIYSIAWGMSGAISSLLMAALH
ncbi:MAG: hypothetical protein MUO92_02760 [Dehalococcoidales bacterium]|nr:hypothetical protein [Dehalococcoidales bacterium]